MDGSQSTRKRRRQWASPMVNYAFFDGSWGERRSGQREQERVSAELTIWVVPADRPCDRSAWQPAVILGYRTETSRSWALPGVRENWGAV